MGSLSPLTSGAQTVDQLLGNAYPIVKHVQENLADITTVAEQTDEIALLAANLTEAAGALVADHVAIILAGLANFRATYAEGVADFLVGEYFTSAESGALRLYRRVIADPFYEDQGDVVAPISKSLLAATTGAGLIGTTDAITVQAAIDARPTALELADEAGAATIGALDEDDAPSSVQIELDARPTTVTLAEAGGAALVGATHGAGATVAAVLAALTPTITTQAVLADVDNAANTTNKFLGKPYIVSDLNNRLFYAMGPANVTVWQSADGLSVITPV